MVNFLSGWQVGIQISPKLRCLPSLNIYSVPAINKDSLSSGGYPSKNSKKNRDASLRHKEASADERGIRFYEYSDVNITLIITNFCLYLMLQWWPFPVFFCYCGDVVNDEIWEVSPLKNPIDPL